MTTLTQPEIDTFFDLDAAAYDQGRISYEQTTHPGHTFSERRERLAEQSADEIEPEENSGQGLDSPHETSSADRVGTLDLTRVQGPQPVSTALTEKQAKRYAERVKLWRDWQDLGPGYTPEEAAKELGVSSSKLRRLAKRVAEKGEDEGLRDEYHNSGRTSANTLTNEEAARLQALYLKTNRTADAGSMQTACKFFALDPQTREDLRAVILTEIDQGRVPRFCARTLKEVTAVHVAMKRQPKGLGATHLSGSRGAFARDKFERRRVVESDDGTINVEAWIPWPQGGDACSDKWGVRLGRWQFLPALESGWSHFYLGYVHVARPRGSYRTDDVRSVISMVAHQHGLPDTFRFERGTWESNAIVDLLKGLGVELETVFQSNQKPFVEGGFNAIWTYLSVIDGQVGRFRGEMEEENKLVQRVRAGRVDPREQFPSVQQCIKAIDGALAMRNSDKIHSIYGSWVPAVRHQQLSEDRPWTPLPAAMDYLFSPFVREWTVAKGTVGNMVTLVPDLETPMYFAHDELWRWNGKKVRVYFDPTQPTVIGTVVAMCDHVGYRAGDVVCRAELFGELPHHARAAVGWASGDCAKPYSHNHAQRAAVRRETRALGVDGRVKASTTEEHDGQGRMGRVERSGGHSTVTVVDRSAPGTGQRRRGSDLIQIETIEREPAPVSHERRTPTELSTADGEGVERITFVDRDDAAADDTDEIERIDM